MNKIFSMNLELTTACPLHCPQCYCSFDKVRHMDFSVAKHWLEEAVKENVKLIALSGGETMCYPHLYDVITLCKQHGFKTAASFSGWNFTEDSVRKLIDTGIDTICISLNGSTDAINRLTRDGYDLAIHALELLHKAGFPHIGINWVMHKNNADDFDNILTIAQMYAVEFIDIISFKPDAQNQMSSVPATQQLLDIAAKIKAYRGPVKLAVESCYSPLRALVADTVLFGNLNLGINKGCRAGLAVVSVSVDGLLSPCRHLYLYEKYDTLAQYWTESPVLKTLRNADQDIRQPCSGCKYLPNCRHCLAINKQMHDGIYFGNKTCGLGTGL